MGDGGLVVLEDDCRRSDKVLLADATTDATLFEQNGRGDGECPGQRRIRRLARMRPQLLEDQGADLPCQFLLAPRAVQCLRHPREATTMHRRRTGKAHRDPLAHIDWRATGDRDGDRGRRGEGHEKLAWMCPNAPARTRATTLDRKR